MKAVMYVCPACGHQVSITAKTCPACGNTLERKRGFFGKVWLVVFWLFNLNMLIGVIAAAGEPTGTVVSQMVAVWLIGGAILGLLTYVTRGKPMI